MGYWRNSPYRDTLAFRTEKNPHLGPKPMNTRPKARQCGEVKSAHFKDRTSDPANRLVSHHHQVLQKLNAEDMN
ncbi:hypothetical protein Hanom_Chr09g00803481 [Helianthus anomalus]